jgi:hypothetical protein
MGIVRQRIDWSRRGRMINGVTTRDNGISKAVNTLTSVKAKYPVTYRSLTLLLFNYRVPVVKEKEELVGLNATTSVNKCIDG